MRKKGNLFQEIVSGVEITHDIETNQYSLINDDTPGIYGLGDTKEEAVLEYLSGMADMILIAKNQKNEALTYA